MWVDMPQQDKCPITYFKQAQANVAVLLSLPLELLPPLWAQSRICAIHPLITPVLFPLPSTDPVSIL